MTSLLPKTLAGASAGAELVTSDGRSLALVGARLVGEAQGGLARLVLEQMFENTYDENLRVTYRMPLPADGAISGYEFEIGERVIKGSIDKKAQARDRFERAIASGHTAALLEQERADIFTQQIGNIPPRATILARITVDQRLVWLPEGEWELRFPTVIGPRYIGSADSAADARATHVKVASQPLRSTVQIALGIKDTIRGGGKASSPSHSLAKSGDTYELSAGARLDRDIVLRWPVSTPAVGISLAAARPATGPLRDAFGLLTIVPPARDAKPLAVPRDLIVLLDTSGSMSGFPLDKAKQVVAMLIDSLDEQDRFELIEFNYSPTRYLAEPTMATAKAKQAAIQWVRSRVADGGTEIRHAVIEAMDTLRVGAQRQVIVVTDGYVGGEQQIIEAMNRRLPKSCRVHVLGVGAAVNRSLATSIARAGRGVEVIIGVDEDAERGAKRLLDRTCAPVVTNVELSGSALLRHAPELMPDCFEGAPLVAALALRPEGGELVVRGQLARGTWEQTMKVAPLQPGDGNQAIVALYGRERVADVEAHALFASVNGEVEELGLSFQIATRMTSWVAVDETRKVTGPTRDQLIPQELPYGTSASAFGLRAASAQDLTRTGGGGARTQMGLARLDVAVLGRSASFDEVDLGEGSAPGSSAYDDDESSDFGEEAPAEIFGESPPPPARSVRAMQPMAPPPAPSAPKGAPGAPGAPPPRAASVVKSRKRAITEQDARPEPEPSFASLEAVASAPEYTKAEPSAQAADSAAPSAPDAAKVTPAQSAPVPTERASRHFDPYAAMKADLAPLQQATPSKLRSRWPMMFAALLVLGLIALLLWWLLG